MVSGIKKIVPLLIAVVLLTSVIGCTAARDSSNEADVLKVGHSGGNLPAALYAAQGSEGFDKKYAVERLQSISTVAYALLSGHLDIGFVDAEKIHYLAQLEGFENLRAVGKVTYPYGATLVLRKGINKRLTELGGLHIAVSSPNCKLLHAFETDAARLNADISGVNYTTLAFDAMLPALEAGAVDGVIIKGFYSVVALNEGHTVLYQNWDVELGDECCPAILDQAALILLAHESKMEAAKEFAALLQASQNIGQDALRRVIAENTTIPYDILIGQPVPEFSLAGSYIITVFVEADRRDDYNHDDDL